MFNGCALLAYHERGNILERSKADNHANYQGLDMRYRIKVFGEICFILRLELRGYARYTKNYIKRQSVRLD